MKFSIVDFSEAKFQRRIDAGYFHPNVIRIRKVVQNFPQLKENTLLISDFGAYSQTNLLKYRSSGVRFIRNQDLDEVVIQEKDPVFIDFEIYKKLSLKLEENDLVLSRVGTLGKSGVINKELLPCSANQNIAQIRTKKNLSPFYLAIFFSSKYGKVQINSLATGNVQQWLNLAQIESIKVPMFNSDFQEFIENICVKGMVLLRKSRNCYNLAEGYLLQNLGISNWKHTGTLFFEKNFKQCFTSERIDAEFFQPKYDEIEAKIRGYKNGWDKLHNLVENNRNNFKAKSKKKYSYIELANISSQGYIQGLTRYLGRDLPSRARRLVSDGDVLVSSIEGSLNSIAMVSEDHNHAICSTGFHVIRSKTINPETLMVFFKSITGQMQLKKRCNGTILSAISNQEFAKVIIPRIENCIQESIKCSIQEMYRSIHLSRGMNKIAKSGVEIAIEKDEEKAMDWMDRELDKLKISI